MQEPDNSGMMEAGGEWDCRSCKEKRLLIKRKCKKYTPAFIASLYGGDGSASPIGNSAQNPTKSPIVKRSLDKYLGLSRNEYYEMARAGMSRDQIAEEISKKNTKATLGKPDDDEDKSVIIFEKDGYKHYHCPVSDLEDETIGIISDTLYCIRTNTLPNEGGCLDQSIIFRVAYMAVCDERDAIKNEKETKAYEDAKNKNNTKQSSGGKKGRK